MTELIRHNDHNTQEDICVWDECRREQEDNFGMSLLLFKSPK